MAEVGGALRCGDVRCGKSFPVVAGRPVLIDEARSVFHRCDYQSAPATSRQARRGARSLPRAPAERPGLWLNRIPSPSVNLSAVRCFGTMKRLLLERTAAPVVLLVGGGIRGKGMSALTGEPAIRLINVDPSPNSTASVFCDAHDLPFKDGSVDAVVAQAVLEHVADPWRCAEEIHRVLKPNGIVYAETPFMQQVHLCGFDFTRFSHMGHQRLFRRFAEIESGAVAGPGTCALLGLALLPGLLDPLPAARQGAGALRADHRLLLRADRSPRRAAPGRARRRVVHLFPRHQVGGRRLRRRADRRLPRHPAVAPVHRASVSIKAL